MPRRLSPRSCCCGTVRSVPRLRLPRHRQRPISARRTARAPEFASKASQNCPFGRRPDLFHHLPAWHRLALTPTAASASWWRTRVEHAIARWVRDLPAAVAVGLAIDNLSKPVTTLPGTRYSRGSSSDRRDQNPRCQVCGLRPVAAVVGRLQCFLQTGWARCPVYGSNQDNVGSILRSLRAGSLPSCRSHRKADWPSALHFSPQHDNAWTDLLSARSLH